MKYDTIIHHGVWFCMLNNWRCKGFMITSKTRNFEEINWFGLCSKACLLIKTHLLDQNLNDGVPKNSLHRALDLSSLTLFFERLFFQFLCKTLRRWRIFWISMPNGQGTIVMVSWCIWGLKCLRTSNLKASFPINKRITKVTIFGDIQTHPQFFL